MPSGVELTYDYIKEYIRSYGYTLLSQTFEDRTTHLDIQCDNKGNPHQYQATWITFRAGHKCPYCRKLKIDFPCIQEYIKDQGYILLTEHYINAKTKLCLICPRGHDCQISWDNFRTNGVRCGTCNESKGERRVAALLTRAKVFYKRGYSLQKGKSPLRLDFYISTLNLGIEFDGEQHFEPVRFRGIDIERARRIFKKIKKRDRAKNNLCKKLGINLFRIKYTDNIEQVLGKWVKV